MKLFSIFAVIAATVASVCAASIDTNAARFARGLQPLPPRNLYGGTPVAGLSMCTYNLTNSNEIP